MKLKSVFAVAALSVAITSLSAVAADKESGKSCCSSDFNTVVCDTSAVSAKDYTIELPTGNENFPLKKVSLEGLVDQRGDTLTSAYVAENIKGKKLWIYFGFPECTVFCPPSIKAMRDAYLNLERPDDLVVLAIASQKGKTPAQMKGFVGPLAEAGIPVIGLTGPDDLLGAVYTPAIIVKQPIHSPVVSFVDENGGYRGGALPISKQEAGGKVFYRPEPGSVEKGNKTKFGSLSGSQPVPGR